MNYHAQIMNLGANCTHAGSPREDVMRAYMEGHKRARHEAAEIANEADAEIERLRGLLRDCHDIAQEYGGCDLWDACDNDGNLYQSQALADALRVPNA